MIFQKTLQRLVAALKDGHGRVSFGRQKANLQPPLTLDWVDGQFVVTRVQTRLQTGKAEGVAPGDRILKFDGKPVEQAAAEARALISGATEQWIRYRSAAELSEFECAPPKYKNAETYTEPRPDKIAELEPGILYVDLDRVTEADWTAAVPRLEKAAGIIFDMRGYPGQPGIQALAHLTDSPMRSAKWNVASAAMPDRLDSTFHESGWPVPPEKPYFSARRVFLTDGRAISYAGARESLPASRRVHHLLDRNEGAQARRLATSRHRHSTHRAGGADAPGRGGGQGRDSNCWRLEVVKVRAN